MQLPEWINSLLEFLLHPTWKTWKKGFILASVSCVLLIYLLYKDDVKLNILKNSIEILNNSIKQLKSENEDLKSKIKDLNLKLKTLGLATEETSDIQKAATDFKRDWDTSDFYLVGNDTFCPKNKGGNNFQRIVYNYDTPLVSSNLNLKFQMVDQNNKITNYSQRVVVGTKVDDAVLSEYDIPTRDDTVVNFRVASESGKLVAGGEGKPINSPIKDKSTINLDFRTQLKYGQETTQIVELDYVSVYGEEKKSIGYDVKVNDSRPETARANLFVGSYIGGCIKVIGWHAS